MKICNVLIALVAVATFSVPAVAQTSHGNPALNGGTCGCQNDLDKAPYCATEVLCATAVACDLAAFPGTGCPAPQRCFQDSCCAPPLKDICTDPCAKDCTNPGSQTGGDCGVWPMCEEQPSGDTCPEALPPNKAVNMCAMSVGLTDPEGDGGYDICWGGYGQRDAWYHFIATDTQHRIRTDVQSVDTDTHFQVYSGGCAALVEVPSGCSEDEVPAGWYGDICVDGLTPGQEYHIQLGTYAVDHDYYGPSYNWCNYYQSMTFTVDVSTKFEDKANEICGDGAVNSPCEECETDADCEGGWLCDQECKCSIPPPVPMLPTWGLVGLGLLLLAGGAIAFRRRPGVGLQSR